MTLFPNCKINLGLRVVRKREDGYHDIETIFYPVFGLHDELEVTLSDAFSFIEEGIPVDCPPEKNLIVRCYRMMKSKYPLIGPVAIRFRKNIPFGAGLGGGSSDAAHLAIALNHLFMLGLNKEQLASDVKQLGADCPFFIYNTPSFATGIGDVLFPVQINLHGFRLVLIKPEIHISTGEAYAGIRIQQNDTTWNLSDFLSDKNSFTNDFESSVFPLHPQLAVIKQKLIDAGAVYAAMSGSGSTLFGLFKTDSECGSYPSLRTLYEEFASMIIFDNTL